jgi:excisionase family DNA binding protein
MSGATAKAGTPATINVEDAAKVLRISRGAAYEAARTGELLTIRFGRRLLVPTARLAEMLGTSPAQLLEMRKDQETFGFLTGRI